MGKKFSQLTEITTPAEGEILAILSGGDLKKVQLGKLLVTRHPTSLQWNVVRLPASAMKQDVSSKPDFDHTNNGYLFDPGTTESLYGIIYLPHTWLEDSTIKSKVNWVQSAAGVVVWQLQYKWSNIGEVMSPGFTTLTAVTPSYSWSAGDLFNVTPFADIPGTNKKISSVLQIILSRLGADGADNYALNALMLDFDLHIQNDSTGSAQEYIK